MKKRSLIVPLLGALLVVCMSCTERPGDSPDLTTLTVLSGGDEAITGPNWDSYLKLLVFSPLARRNEQGELEPVLAESWETSDEGRSWTVRLRKDAKWHDGVPFTARDVEFTLNLMARPQVLRELPESFTLTVLDDWTYTIEFHTRSNASIYPLSTWTVFYPKHLLEHLDPEEFTTWDFWKEPIGTGPFRYLRHVPQTMVEFEANPEYFGGRPRIDRVVAKFGESAITELLSGNVDQAWVTPLEAVKLGESPDFAVYFDVHPENPQGIAWNQNRPMFRDPSVRRALTLAINRVELRRVINMPEEVPVFDVLVSDEMYGKREFPEPLPFDPELAERLLEEAGWSDTDGDGIRDRDGIPFQFTLLAGYASIPTYVQESLRRIGIGVEIRLMPRGLDIEQVRTGDFDATLRPFRNRHYQEFFGRESLIGFVDDRVVAGIDSVTQAVTSLHREAAFRALAPVFQETMPVTFLVPFVNYEAFHRRIGGLGQFGGTFVQRIEKLWIEEDD